MENINKLNMLENQYYNYLFNKCADAVELAQKDAYNEAIYDVIDILNFERKIITLPNSNGKIVEVLNINYEEIIELEKK